MQTLFENQIFTIITLPTQAANIRRIQNQNERVKFTGRQIYGKYPTWRIQKATKKPAKQ